MGRRSEQRIAIAFPVVVRGTDSRGTPFEIATETYDISCTGACLRGLEGVAEPGRKIEIACKNQKAWYRVQWVSKANSARQWRFGVRCLEPGKYIWGVAPKEWEPDKYDAAAANAQDPATSARSQQSARAPDERRRFARHACCIDAQLNAEGAYGGVAVKGKITDISLGGCYMEMFAPLPVDMDVELTFSTGESPLQISAKVRSALQGFGMGLAFTGMSPEAFEVLRQIAPPAKDAAKKPEQGPRVASYIRNPRQKSVADAAPAPNSGMAAREPQTAATRAEADTRFAIYRSPETNELGSIDLPEPAIAVEALARLLIRKKLISLAELLEELEALKTAQS